jgi:hypothetical protein
MAAPHRVRVSLPDVEVSAFILPPLEVALEGKPVCKTCAPRRTTMRHILSVNLPLRDGLECYAVFECGTCATQWAITWLELREGV